MGIDIKESRIPILPECKILCDQYALEPLATIASGALLIGCPSSAAPAIVRELLAAGIAAPVIGKETEPGEGVTIRARAGIVPLPVFVRDGTTMLFAAKRWPIALPHALTPTVPRRSHTVLLHILLDSGPGSAYICPEAGSAQR